jgi:Zn-dependent protease/CBS domain-containing protein
MRGSLRLFSISGIGIYIHWTFLLIIGWVVFQNSKGGAAQAMAAVGLTLSVFVCVLLHELGHALMGQHYGIRTRDITLLLIGGVARLERIPERPVHEIWIALAGPFVNVVIAAALLAGLIIGRRLPGSAQELVGALDPTSISGLRFLLTLLALNVFMVLFNLIPAFPMDGGRVLRAVLAIWLDYPRATRIAAWIGQAVALGFVAWGLWGGGWILIFIGGFVFLGAQAEARMANLRADLSAVRVRDAMLTRFAALPVGTTLADASSLLLSGPQQDFPVMDGDRIAGVLPRSDLLRALESSPPQTPVSAVMRTDCTPVDENEPLFRVIQRMQEANFPVIPVTRRGLLIGLVTIQTIGEFLSRDGRAGSEGRPAESRPALHP